MPPALECPSTGAKRVRFYSSFKKALKTFVFIKAYRWVKLRQTFLWTYVRDWSQSFEILIKSFFFSGNFQFFINVKRLLPTCSRLLFLLLHFSECNKGNRRRLHAGKSACGLLRNKLHINKLLLLLTNMMQTLRMCFAGISFGRSKLLQSRRNLTLKPELEPTV